MNENGLRVGEVARATGLTIRTLRYYDSLGLLSPAERSTAGQRLYHAADIERLYRIQALRRLGFALADIGALLRREGDRPLTEVISAQLDQVRQRIEAERRLEARLVDLQAALGDSGTPTDRDLITLMGSMTMLDKQLRHDYSRQAARYDSTRSASPSVIAPLVDALAGAPGTALLDIGGGTGNYAAAFADRGWSVTVVDVSADMRAQAAAKGLLTMAGDATAVPAADASADAMMMVSMLHQVEGWQQALAEARRVLRPGGRLAIMGLWSDHLEEVNWAYELFPSMAAFAGRRRPSLADVVAELPGARIEPFWFTDLLDASIGALCAYPEAVLDPRVRRQTSFFERMERDNPAELADGLARLRAQLDRGESPLTARAEARGRLGDATVIGWVKP